MKMASAIGILHFKLMPAARSEGSPYDSTIRSAFRESRNPGGDLSGSADERQPLCPPSKGWKAELHGMMILTSVHYSVFREKIHGGPRGRQWLHLRLIRYCRTKDRSAANLTIRAQKSSRYDKVGKGGPRIQRLNLLNGGYWLSLSKCAQLTRATE